MTDFIVNSIIASVVLTALINVIPRLFPGSSAEQRIQDLVGEAHEPPTRPPMETTVDRPPFRIWFPWKQMILWSMAITIVINVVQFVD